MTRFARRSAPDGLAKRLAARAKFWSRLAVAAAFAGAILAGPGVFAATKPAAAGKSSADSSPDPFLPGSNSKEPISIDADKLVYFDKEQKAIYSGNVVAIQGDSKLTCSVLTVYLAKNDTQAQPGAAPAAIPTPGAAIPAPAADPAPAVDATPQPPSSTSSQVRHMDAAGQVTVVSKTQVGTGDRGVYDKVENKVWLIGNVTLSDGGNVTKGDKLTYNLTTGEAVVEVGLATQRVHGLFIPGSSDNGDDKSATAKKKTP